MQEHRDNRAASASTAPEVDLSAPRSAPPVDERFHQSLHSVERTLDRYHGCTEKEKESLLAEMKQLERMRSKLLAGRVDIVVFGEISTGKSALINALVGEAVSDVDVRGGWTKDTWRFPWKSAGYAVPGFADSLVMLIDTPGLNEVGGAERALLATDAAEQADLILFVTDSDLNETEYSALVALARSHKPIVLTLNKVDLFSREQRARLMEVLRDERMAGLLDAENVVTTAADPREIEYVVESADGRSRSEWKKPPPDVAALKARILEVLEGDGLALLALNAAMYAADKSDRVAAVRVEVRDRMANRTIWSYATIKAVAVALNAVPGADIAAGAAVDATMVATLAHIYGLNMSWNEARKLVLAIAQAAGWVLAGELTTHLLSWAVKTSTAGLGVVFTLVPQGAAAGYSSYIVGQAAKYYFEHGASWGGQNPKTVVTRILDKTDKSSVIARLKDEIKAKLARNRYAAKGAGVRKE